MSDWTASRPLGQDPEIAFKQAVTATNQGNLPGAEKIYRALLKQHPRHVRTLRNLATVLMGAGRYEEAIQVLRKALNQEPNSAEAHGMLAWALHNLDRHEEALERAKRAVALNSGSADAHATLARGLADLGRYDEAVRAQARAIELAPDQPRYYYQLGYIARWNAGDPRLAALEGLAQKSASLSLDEQVHLHFARAKAYSDCGDIERSFRHQIEGGVLKRQMLKYDESSSLRRLDEMCHAIGAEWIGRHRDVGDPSPLPVFVVGMPRSGSTLVEQILASHPKVAALGERPLFSSALARICKAPTVPPALPELAARWTDSELRRLGADYIETIRRGASASAARITDKALSNFRVIGLIHASLPNARIIHTCRDPVDTCLSVFSEFFSGDGHPYTYDLGELGRFYRAYERMMAHWRSVLPAGVMIDVKYEDVVDDLEGQARRIVAHCGLEWDDSCLEFHKTDRPVRTASHAQVRQPIYRSSVGRRRPPRELLLPLLKALGVD